MSPDPHAAAESPAAPPSTEREPNLLHFGLRQWFYFISGVVILCGLFARLEMAGALVLASMREADCPAGSDEAAVEEFV